MRCEEINFIESVIYNNGGNSDATNGQIDNSPMSSNITREIETSRSIIL